MPKKIICVYQDCPLCGDKGKIVQKIAQREGFQIEKVSFASKQGGELIHEAVFDHGIGTMPFYTDGEKFSTNIDDFVEHSRKNVKKTPKKGRKNVKGADDGVAE